MIPYQPPAHSPLSGAAIIRAAFPTRMARRAGAEESLRELLAGRLEAEETLLCGSGTQALDLALRVASAAVTSSQEPAVVALPGYTCFDVASAAVGAGLPMTFYDLDPRTLSPDLDSVRRALDFGARVVVVSPLYGYPVSWDELASLVGSRGALIIEDAAQAAGATWHNRPVGSFGDLSILSFGRGKGWTGGSGGAILARGEAAHRLREVQDRLTMRRPSSWRGVTVPIKTLAQWAFARPALFGIPSRIPWLELGETRYHEPTRIGTILPFSARLAILTSEHSSRERNERVARAAMMEEALKDAGGDSDHRLNTVDVAAGGEAGYLRLPVLLQSGIRHFTAPEQARRLGIRAGYPSVLEDLPAVQDGCVDRVGDLPGCRRIVRELVTLPTHRFVTREVREAILAALVRQP